MVALIRLRLKKNGLKCLVAQDLESALACEPQLEQDFLLLLDHMLPNNVTGVEVLRAFLDQRPDTVAVVMSSTEDAKSVVEYMKAGAKDYLFKGEGFMDMLSHVTTKTMDSIAQQRRLKAAEETLRVNEYLLSRSQHMASMGSWRRDLLEDRIYWSEAMQEVLDLEAFELEGPDDQWFLNHIHPEDLFKFLRSRSTTLQSGETSHVEFRFRKDEQSQEKVLKAVHDVDCDDLGRPISLLGAIQDITVQKRAEMEFEKFSRAVEQSSASIVITDMSGTIEYVNEKFMSLSGYDKEELIGRHTSILKSGEHSDGFYQKLWKTLNSGQEWTGEFCNKKKNGDLYWESASISAILNDRGERVNFLAVKEDISEKKKFQSTMMKLNKALMTANRQAEKLAADFELFVPHQFTRRMREEGPGVIRSGFAMEEHITIMFADIRSFTTLSENLGSQDTFKFLNDYLKKVEPCIKDNGGFVDKFVGDGILALFDGEDGPSHAVQAAIEMQKTVTEFNVAHPEMSDIVLGMGIHYGPVIIGALGSESRLDSTVIGDAVNLTSRIEELTKRFRAQILVTDRALSHVDTDGLNMRKVMSLKVRGKEEVTELFELFEANHPDDLQLKIETKPMLEQAIRCYEAHQFEEAKSCFQKVLNVNDSDVLATDYMVRCRYLSKFPSSELSQLGVLEDMNHYLNYASQRRDFRHPVRISGKVQWGEMCFPHEDVTFSNLSLRGMRMEGCKLPLKIGSIIKLYLFTSEVLPYFKSDLEVVSQVVWSNEKHENAQLGLQIVWMTRENEDGLIYLLEKLEQKKDSES